MCIKDLEFSASEKFLRRGDSAFYEDCTPPKDDKKLPLSPVSDFRSYPIVVPRSVSNVWRDPHMNAITDSTNGRSAPVQSSLCS